MGERVNGIHEVRGSIPLASIPTSLLVQRGIERLDCRPRLRREAFSRE